MAVNNVKGTRDIIGEEANAFNYIENLLKQICELFAYYYSKGSPVCQAICDYFANL